MQACRILSLVALGFALVAPARAQEGTWDVSGEVRYVSHYEGQTVRGRIPFSLETTLDADGQYEVVLPACVAGAPPVVVSGTWMRGSYRFLRAAVRDAIQANLTSCGSSGVRVRNLEVRQRLARDEQSFTGKLTANVRYQFLSGDEIETVRARIHGDYLATRRSE